jgi:hypothetical protein
MTTHHSAASATPTSARTILLAARAAAVLAVLSILWQGYSASRVIVAGGAALGPHEVGAVVAHVTTGLLALAVALHWWTTRGPVWPAAVAAAVFAATFVEASLGHEVTLWAHVPLAMLITIGTTAVFGRVWAAAVTSAVRKGRRAG